MTFGSFVAGSTFLGGGAVAFLTLTKMLLVDPVTAKSFSLAIQSVGMTAASIYIFVLSFLRFVQVSGNLSRRRKCWNMPVSFLFSEFTRPN